MIEIAFKHIELGIKIKFKAFGDFSAEKLLEIVHLRKMKIYRYLVGVFDMADYKMESINPIVINTISVDLSIVGISIN